MPVSLQEGRNIRDPKMHVLGELQRGSGRVDMILRIYEKNIHLHLSGGNTPTRSAMRLEPHTPAAAIARERAANPKVIGPTTCTTPPSLRSPLPRKPAGQIRSPSGSSRNSPGTKRRPSGNLPRLHRPIGLVQPAR